MSTVKAIPISSAAEILGVGSIKLLRLLREKGILLPCNSPAQEYRDSGELQLKFAQFYLPGTLIKKTKPMPCVTQAGWHLLETIARDIRHGNTPEMAAPIWDAEIQPSEGCSKEESAKRCAGIRAILDEKTDADAA